MARMRRTKFLSTLAGKEIDREKLVTWLEQEVQQYINRCENEPVFSGYCEEADYILRMIRNGMFDK